MTQFAGIPEIQLQLSPQTDEAKQIVGFKWAGEAIGSRSKLGGTPDWLQSPNTPSCSCGKIMTFYAQLASIGDSVSIEIAA